MKPGGEGPVLGLVADIFLETSWRRQYGSSSLLGPCWAVFFYMAQLMTTMTMNRAALELSSMALSKTANTLLGRVSLGGTFTDPFEIASRHRVWILNSPLIMLDLLVLRQVLCWLNTWLFKSQSVKSRDPWKNETIKDNFLGDEVSIFH